MMKKLVFSFLVAGSIGFFTPTLNASQTCKVESCGVEHPSGGCVVGGNSCCVYHEVPCVIITPTT